MHYLGCLGMAIQGVRALLIDKDGSATWAHKSAGQVSKELGCNSKGSVLNLLTAAVRVQAKP